MKRMILPLLGLFCVANLSARETLNIVERGVTYTFAGERMGKAVFADSESFSLMGREFRTSQVERLFVDGSEVTDNLVDVNYSASGVRVTVSGNVAAYVTVNVNGEDVTVTQSDNVNADTGEITYRLSGKSDAGSFSLAGSYKSTVELAGLDLKCTSGAALNIQNGKRIALRVNDGTVNTLNDAAGGSQKGAVVCKGHLEIKGKGELNIKGNSAHAIQAKEYVEIKNATVNILGSVKDGINCTQYFLLESGSLTITGVGDDAVQTDFKDATDRELEDIGTITITEGKFTADVTAVAAKGLKAEGSVSIIGGTIDIKTSGKGKWDSEKSKTKSASCISADEDVLVSGGEISLISTGSGGKGISADGTTTVCDGNLKIQTTGGVFAYVNGTEYDGYTGNTDRINSDYKSSPKGIKSDLQISLDGGVIEVRTTGKGAEGIESKSELFINGGTIYVKAYDDAINSSSHMHINGGDITVIATNNDGLDSNGNMYFNGGTVRAFGGSSPECGIDANEEQGYSVYFKGGNILAVGGNNSVPSSTNSTQDYVSGSNSVSANTVITLKNGNEELVSFTVPAEYVAGGGSSPWGVPSQAPGGMGGKGLLISCPGLTSGSSYTLQVGSTTSTVTATLRGSGSTRPW